MALIFLSYTQKDKDKAIKFEKTIESTGHEVWRDDRRIKAGDQIPEGIATGLSSCDFFAPLITLNSLNSNWMKRELYNFLMDSSKGNSIIPLKFDQTDISLFFPLLKPHKYADFSENFDSGIDQVLKCIGGPNKDAIKKKNLLEKDLDRLDFAIDLALRAGSIIMRFYNSSIHLNQNIEDCKNPATIADEMAQKAITSSIMGHDKYRSDEIIAEEKPFNLNSVIISGYTWVIDALDGTTNFRNRIPIFCTAIGVLKDGLPFIGVVFDPINNELYFSLQGEPTKIWNIPKGEVTIINTSKVVEKLSDCITGTHISSRHKIAQRLFENDLFFDIAKKVNNIRTFGCGQLALAYVASGRIPLFFQYGTHLWDQLAGIVLVKNAGGIACEIPNGNDWQYTTQNFFVAANSKVKNAFTDMLKSRE